MVYCHVKGKMSDIAIVIPAFEEAATIADIVTRAGAMSGMVIVVDDGSTDRTAAMAEAAGAQVLRNACNQGKGSSLLRGMQAALRQGAELVVTLDGDGQHRPEDLPRFVAAWRDRPEAIVLGSRRSSQDLALARQAEGTSTATVPSDRCAANQIADFWISWAAGRLIEDSQSGFRLYPAHVLSALRLGRFKGRRFVLESELLIEAGKLDVPVVSVPIAALYGAPLQRPSHFRPVIDITRIVLMVAGKLLSRGMYPQGLFKVWRAKRRTAARTELVGTGS
jgi:glycosyltransferase involved in cell wall biosynthesis